MDFFQELSPNIWWLYLEKVIYFFVFPGKWEHIINAQQIALAVQHYLRICKISAPLKFYSLPFTEVYARFPTQFHLNEFPLLLQPPLFIYHFGNRTDYVSNLVCCLTTWRRIELTQPSFFQELPTSSSPRGPMGICHLISPHLSWPTVVETVLRQDTFHTAMLPLCRQSWT